MDMEQLNTEFDEYGFVLLKNRISTETADLMATRIVEIMSAKPDADRLDQGMQALLDYDDLFLPLVTDPVVLELARRTLGEPFRLAEVGVRWLKPGAPGQSLHADVPLHLFPEPLPDVCFLINTIWMLNDFTRSNGATLLMPFSHHTRRRPRAGATYRHLVAAEAPLGSVVVFKGNLWHAGGANRTRDRHRIGVSVPYFAKWMDRTAGNWQTMPRRVYDRLPPLVQSMVAHKVVDD
ncbi:MAG: phytanoyl-CoA dioxygenase family protein [candidate division Zixibacteria bacterium]|nr:phytanoyl-CoA dioxygenase family protein [candidate division Zixibacteria bacterium]